MKKISVKLFDGSIFEVTNNDYLWNIEEKLNDTRFDFITLGNMYIKKNDISLIQIIDIEEEKDEEQNKKEE